MSLPRGGAEPDALAATAFYAYALRIEDYVELAKPGATVYGAPSSSW